MAYLELRGTPVSNGIGPSRLSQALGIPYHRGSGGGKKTRGAIVEWYERALASCRTQTVKADEFYASLAWKRARYDALRAVDGKCQCCGAPGYQTALHVDHIKPRSLYPDLALEPSNLQVLCADCNIGKGVRDQTNWHWAAQKTHDIVEELTGEQAEHMRNIALEGD